MHNDVYVYTLVDISIFIYLNNLLYLLMIYRSQPIMYILLGVKISS